jgi:hypothetical protein
MPQHDQRVVDELSVASRQVIAVQPAAELACAAAGMDSAAGMGT